MTNEPSQDTTSSGSKEPPEEVPEKLRDFAHFAILKELGRGAQGIVYLAEDKNLHRKVALKMLAGSAAASKGVRERFQREAEITSKLNHPNICGVYEVGEAEEIPYIAMQYVQGTPLGDIIEDSRTSFLSERENLPQKGSKDRNEESTAITLTVADRKGNMQDVVRLIEHSARALHVAHEAGLIHRDIKPGNIMVTPEGNPVLLDFGLARDLEADAATLTASGQIIGTPGYLAPEQIVANREKIDRRTDVYALGVTLFECLTLERPFDADTWDQLFHKILNSAPPNPRRLNPRIPQDLRTVIEVAMERERKRRYQTALDMAEDLRRVRAFEPIKAKAAGPILRLRKWSQRHPAIAVALTAAVLFVVVGGGYLGYQAWSHAVAMRADLDEAKREARNGNFQAAEAAVARAEGRDPSSSEALNTKAWVKAEKEKATLAKDKAESEREAAAARKLAAQKQEEYERAWTEFAQGRNTLVYQQAASVQTYATEDRRAALARKELELRELELQAKRWAREAEVALNVAARHEARWGGVSAATHAAYARFFVTRWRHAVADRDVAETAMLRARVEAHDTAGEFRDELLGRGTLTATVSPTDSAIYLFRYEPYEILRSGVVPRLVPVPTQGVGRARPKAWHGDFRPGDPCLQITAVDAGSPAAAEGLRPGDLVIGLNGGPCVGLYVQDVAGKPLSAAGVKPLARVGKLNGFAVDGQFDWQHLPRPRGQTADRVQILGAKSPVSLKRTEVPCVTPATLARDGGKVAMELWCLRGGEPVTLRVAADQAPGLHCEPTAYPLIFAAKNRIQAGKPLVVDPGSYLLVVRRKGHEDQRFPVLVERRAKVRAKVELNPIGTTPPGFVFVPAGEFVFAGDPDAVEPRAPKTITLPAYFIGRLEVSSREWFEFVNDPEILAQIEARLAKRQLMYLPRDTDGGLYKKRPDGKGYIWHDNFPGFRTTADTPALGLCWHDVRAYVAWRNKKAEAAKEPWVYELPNEEEWEKAARGVDARLFTWGDRFDPSLVVGSKHRPRYLYDAPGGFEPRDESPYGILDLAGSRAEWLRDHRGPRLRESRGGEWSGIKVNLFRAASRRAMSPIKASAWLGFRLLARRRDG